MGVVVVCLCVGRVFFFNAVIRQNVASYSSWIRFSCWGRSQCCTGVTGDADLLGGEMENKGPFVGMQGPLERGELKATVLLPT